MECGKFADEDSFLTTNQKRYVDVCMVKLSSHIATITQNKKSHIATTSKHVKRLYHKDFFWSIPLLEFAKNVCLSNVYFDHVRCSTLERFIIWQLLNPYDIFVIATMTTEMCMSEVWHHGNKIIHPTFQVHVGVHVGAPTSTLGHPQTGLGFQALKSPNKMPSMNLV
jgi:hypothetical protein